MKKTLLTALFILAGISLFSQTDYKQLKEQIQKSYPELNLKDKVIFINFWSAADQESRQRNAELNKTISTYEVARLKGGKKGVIGVAICTDATAGSSVIISSAGFTKLKTVELPLDTQLKNIVYDSDGNVIYQSIEKNKMFESIHQLITR